jgi:hypothetical protein
MSRIKFIVSEKHVERIEVLKEIENFGKQNNYKISKGNDASNKGEIDIWQEEGFLLEFIVKNEANFKDDISNSSIIKNKRYYNLIIIDYYGDNLPYFNQFVKYFLELHPDMFVADEAYKDFYSFDQIKKKQVPEWLLI